MGQIVNCYFLRRLVSLKLPLLTVTNLGDNRLLNFDDPAATIFARIFQYW